jgi:hypothetical protein
MNAPDAQNCGGFSRYMEEFRQRLRKAIEENKWFVSERIGHDIGEQRATEDSMTKPFRPLCLGNARQFLRAPLHQVKKRPLAAIIRSLPSTAQSLDVNTTRLKGNP